MATGSTTNNVILALEAKRDTENKEVAAIDRQISDLQAQRAVSIGAAHAYQTAIDQIKGASGGNGLMESAPRVRAPAGAVEKSVRDMLSNNPMNVERLIIGLAHHKSETVRATVRKLVKAGAIHDAGGVLNLAPSA